MTDIRKIWSQETFEADISVVAPFGVLDTGEEILTAVINSLFTWRRANPDDRVDGPTRYGWWGDSYLENEGDRVGSRLWLLQREKMTNETLARARTYAEEALEWMLEDGVCSFIEVDVTRVSLHTAVMIVRVTRGDGVTTYEIPWRELIDE